MATNSHHRSIAEVVIPIPVDTPFSYLIPPDFDDLIQPGVQVIVPFGERFVAGIVIKKHGTDPPLKRELKSIHDVVSAEPYIGEDLLSLLEWISGYYICHLGEAFRLVHPSHNILKSRMELRKLKRASLPKLTPRLEDLWKLLPEEQWIGVRELEKKMATSGLLYRINRLKAKQLIETRYTLPRQKKIFRTIDVFSLRPKEEWEETARIHYRAEGSARYTKARNLIAFLEAQEQPVSRGEIQSAGFGAHLIRRLERQGVLSRSTREIERTQEGSFREMERISKLFEEQQIFIDRVRPHLHPTPSHKTFLLHGITGSGKTQIYIELVRETLRQGRQAIVLIPEIVLTPQIMARFRNEFGKQVAVLHSRISSGERMEVLRKIRDNQFSVVIGPRSAVFAPFKKLGLIIVDEEHESSYKQSDSTPRYHAREVALYRAYLNNIPVVLGSATPSLESMYNARNGKYEYFHLSKRIHSRNLPRTQLVNFREEWRRTGGLPVFSEMLLLKLESRLLCREQAILLQNRRGFSPYIQCQDCGFVMKCPNCEVTLTYHYAGKNLRCHYCGHTEPAPDTCPQCKGLDILYKGVGTQKLEQEAKEHFPHARFLRMDQDTTRRKDDHDKLLEKFRRGEADVLLGTKMIAKGLDFERVTLVGILNADEGLHFPDFRAAEKVFQLLVQAAGRAGRGAQSGEVIIQTFDPNHYLFKYLLTHNYLGFYEREMETRKTLLYPPFSRLCLIRVSGESEEKVFAYAQHLSRYLWKANPEKRFRILGPAPAPLVKLKNRYRYHILIKQDREIDPSMSYVRQLIKEGIVKNPELKKLPVDVVVDMDPLEIL